MNKSWDSKLEPQIKRTKLMSQIAISILKYPDKKYIITFNAMNKCMPNIKYLRSLSENEA